MVKAGRFWITILAIFILGVSCTRKSASSRISIQLDNSQSKASNSAFSNDIQVAILNITGPGMQPIFIELECKLVSCSEFNVEVPTGSDRLIQVLAVRAEPPFKKIYYAEQFANLDQPDEEVHLSLAEQGQYQREGRWVGQYIPSLPGLQNRRLTGQVSILFPPPSGTQAMVVNRFEMFGGWFETMLLDGLKFQFIFNGTAFNPGDSSAVTLNNFVLFKDVDDQGVSLNSSKLEVKAENGNHAIHVDVPLHFKEEFQGGSSIVRPEPPLKVIAGYFGIDYGSPGSKQVCWEDDDPTSEFVYYDGSDGTENLWFGCTGTTPASCAQPIKWDNTSDAHGIQFDSDLAVSSCPQVANDDFKFNLNLFPHQFGDFPTSMAFGFVGPFRSMRVNGDGLHMMEPVFEGGAVRGMKWRMFQHVDLPGVDIYTTPLSNFNHDEVFVRDGIACHRLNELGFQFRGPRNKSDEYRFPAGESPVNQVLVVCPKKHGGGYYKTALVFEDFGNFVNPVGNINPFQFRLADDNNNTIGAAGPMIDLKMRPELPTGSNSAFLILSNSSPHDVALDFSSGSPFYIFFNEGVSNSGLGNFVVDDNPGSLPPAIDALPIPNCGGQTVRVLSNGGGQCLVEIIFQAESTPGATIHDYLTFDYEVDGQYHYIDLPIVGSVAHLHLYSAGHVGNTLTNLTFDAPPGHWDIKHLIIFNDGPGGADTITFDIDTANMSGGEFTLNGYKECANANWPNITIPMGQECILEFYYTAPSTAEDSSQYFVFNNYAQTGTVLEGATPRLLGFVGMTALEFDTIDPHEYDFGGVAPGTSLTPNTYTLTNWSSGFATQIIAASAPSDPFDFDPAFTTGYCAFGGGAFVAAAGGSCSYDLGVSDPEGDFPEFDNMYFYYYNLAPSPTSRAVWRKLRVN